VKGFPFDEIFVRRSMSGLDQTGPDEPERKLPKHAREQTFSLILEGRQVPIGEARWSYMKEATECEGYGMLPFWDALRTRPAAQAAMRGTNAAVVGILGVALYNPVWTNAILTPGDFALALGGFLSLTVWRMPAWIVVALLAVAGALSILA
jgi:hypothetical protein